MKARQKATKQVWNGVTKLVQPLGKVFTSARKLANNLTPIERVNKLKKSMKVEVIKKQNSAISVYVQVDERKVVSISSKEAETVFRDFTQKYKTTKEARAALLKLKKYENTIQYKNIKFLVDNSKWEDWIKHETIMGDIQGDPVASFFLNTGELPRNPTLNFKNKNSLSKIESQISDKALKEVRKKWGQKGVDAFEKAKDKGIVGAKGESGIKILKGKGIKKGSKTYTHEIKVKNNEYGDYRIYGYKNENGNFIFDWFDKGKH